VNEEIHREGWQRSESQQARAFTDEAEREGHGVMREFWSLLRHNKKWWLAPIILSLVVLGAVIALSSTAVAPLIYTLF